MGWISVNHPRRSMLILFDHGTPKGLTHALIGHTIITAQARGWDKLNNSELLDATEEAAVDLLLTTGRKSVISRTLPDGESPSLF